MIEALLVGSLAFALSLAIGRPAVRYLRERRIGKLISEDAPSTHSVKAGTPTMGGLFIWGTVAILTLFANVLALQEGTFAIERRSMLLPLGAIVLMMAVGFWDDLGTLVETRIARGLTWRVKFLIISAMSAAAAAVLFWALDAQSIHIPGVGSYSLGYVYLLIAFVTVFATTSAVSITDGLDGLLGGTAALSFAAYGVIAAAQGQEFLAVFCLTVVGALLGFLWYNAHPALVFMGDTGALPLGAALAIVALMTGHWLLLPVIGVVFVAEALSDVLQIAYFKTTQGHRLFRKTPLHHHLELLGWSEPQVVLRMYLFGVAGAMVGIALALMV